MQPKRSRVQWRQIVDRYEASGLKPKQFAVREGLNVNTFSWWRHEFRQEARRESRLTLVPVPRPARNPIVIRLPDGVEVEVPAGSEPDWVGRIADALR